ncbi:MAG: 1-acyl-sn-glycerol-3-phosphate acyltransferase [Spirochaetes bacterium]|nr:1-acyl-sn-glycerol-3-phosphate acyltransferase [Spirochaetota bacterium]
MYHYEINDEFTRLFFDYAKKMMKNSKMNEDTLITPENIYQPAIKNNRDYLFEIIKMSHLEGSTILGAENLIKLFELAKKGHSCIILSEHVSNLDVPSMFVRFYDHKNDLLKEIFEKIIFIAGVKLNENPLVKLYTEMFSRIVIFPIRSIEKLTNDETQKEKINLAKKINIKSTRKIKELRNAGFLFVLFPSGTRYRPWLPETKKSIKETSSFLKSFDYFCCSSINGNNMLPGEHEDMTKEQFIKDVLVINYGEIKKTKDYIDNILKSADKKITEDTEKSKQFIGDKIMEEIEQLHNKAEEYRKKFLK